MNSNQRIQGGLVRIDSKCYPIFKGVNTVGRNKTAIVNVKNLNVSQYQALVVIVDENQHFIVDMNSSNGTFLGNTKLVPFMLYELENNNDIKFADIQAKYLKVSNTNNINNNLLNQTLEMTQNVTQNFYAANTQLMDANESHLEHNYTNINKSSDNHINDIHEMATQEANFSSYFQNKKHEPNKATSDAVTTQILSEEEIITNIHDAPTQVFTFRQPSPVKNQNLVTNLNVQKHPAHTIESFNEENLLQQKKIQELEATSSNNADKQPSNNQSDISVYQESSETIILSNNDGIQVNDEEILSSNNHSGVSTLQNNITFDESLLNNSNNISVSQKAEIEESVIEENVAESAVDSNSNDSVDFLINAPLLPKDIEEDKILSNHSFSEDMSNQQEKPLNILVAKTVGSDSDTDIESDSSSIGNVRKKTLCKLPSSNDMEDGDVEKCKKKMLRKQQVKKVSSHSSDSETEIESTQEIGIIKKPLKKLHSDDESSGSETDCENLGLNTKEIDKSDLRKESKTIWAEQIKNVENHVCNLNNENQNMAKSCMENQSIKKHQKNLNDDNLSEVPNVDCRDNIEEEKKADTPEISILKKDSIDDRKSQNTSEDKLNDTDCIPATEDAFAEAFSYRSQGGGKSSTEDFRLGLTQFMEDSLTDGILKTTECKENSNSEEHHREKINNQEEQKDADDIYLMATQHINNTQTNRNVDDDSIVTHQTIKQANVPSTSKMCDIFDIPTQRLLETKSSSETDKDDDDVVYMLATQPMNTESQFKLPKTFTFKKKTAVLEESLSTLLGESNKDDDIFDVPTQKMLDFQKPVSSIFEEPTQELSEIQKQDQDKYNDIFDVPTQKIAEPQKLLENNENDVFDAPTQNVPEHINSNDNSRDQILKDSNQLNVETSTENNKKTSNQVQDLFDAPTQAFPTESIESSNTQDELEFFGTNYPSTSENSRPDNPLAHVLNENDKLDTISKLPALRRSRRKSNSPLPEPPENKRQKKSKNSIKMSQITEEKPFELVTQSENSIKECNRDTSTKITEDTFNAKSKLLESADKDNIETLSQIEAFIKKPVVKTYSKKKLLKQTEAKGNVEEMPGPSSTNLVADLKSINDALIVIPPKSSKRKLSTHDEHGKIPKKELPKSRSEVINFTEEGKSVSRRDESEENCSYKNQEVVRSDIDQSFALLESKISKSRKKRIDPVLEDFKVTISSHRRSMGIAETSSVASNKGRRATVASNYGNGRDKRKTQKGLERFDGNYDESDSSDSELSKKKISKGRPKKESTNRKAKAETKIETIDGADGSNKKSETVTNIQSCSFSTTSSSKSLSDTEIDDNFEEKNAAVSKRIPKRNAKFSSKLEEETTSLTNDNATPRKGERKVGSRGRKTIEKMKDDQRKNPGTSIESNTSSDVISTPKKQRSIAAETCSSAERAKRKLKPKVVFTMMDNPHLESLIRQLGGSIVETVNACTVLVTEHVKRSQKLLSAVGQGKPICSPQWIKESKQAGEFLDPWDFILIDREAETKWNFSLKDSIKKAVNQKLLTDYVFQVIATNGADVLKGAIDACGGRSVSKHPGKNSDSNFIVIASSDQRSKYAKTVKQNPNTKVVEPEAIFDGVLRQELRLSKHLLT